MYKVIDVNFANLEKTLNNYTIMGYEIKYLFQEETRIGTYYTIVLFKDEDKKH